MVILSGRAGSLRVTEAAVGDRPDACGLRVVDLQAMCPTRAALVRPAKIDAHWRPRRASRGIQNRPAGPGWRLVRLGRDV